MKRAQAEAAREIALVKYVAANGWVPSLITADVWKIPYDGGTMRMIANKEKIPADNTIFLTLHKAARLQRKWDWEAEHEESMAEAE